MSQTLGTNDGILILSLVYSCIDLSWEWEMFDTCKRPIHRWLLVSYACVVAFRLIHLAGTRCASGDDAEGRAQVGAAAFAGSPSRSTAAVDFLLDLRQKGSVPRILAAFSWLIALPFFVFWTFIGSFWLFQVVNATPSCVPSQTHLWFAGFWLCLCYIWIIVHAALGGVAWVLERRVRNAERNLRAVEDDDVISRWGSVSTLAGYSSLPAGAADAGLSPEEIRALPCETYPGDSNNGAATECVECNQEGTTETARSEEECECAICINNFKTGDCLRKLPSCGHAFHRSCIDLWLLRRADCPLCKRPVRSNGV